MESYNDKVKLFMKVMAQGVPERLSIEDPTVNQLRVKLLTEEVKELEDGLFNKDKVEVLDALVDIQYVLSGAVIAFGLEDIFDEAFDTVHRANMSKLCGNIDIAKQTVEYWEKEKSTKCDYYEVPLKGYEGKYLVRSTLGKVLKPITFQHPNLEIIFKD